MVDQRLAVELGLVADEALGTDRPCVGIRRHHHFPQMVRQTPPRANVRPTAMLRTLLSA
jgi:hypothetical protein